MDTQAAESTFSAIKRFIRRKFLGRKPTLAELVRELTIDFDQSSEEREGCGKQRILKYQHKDQGTPKQFGSGGEIQIWKDVSFWLFFPIPLSHATKKLDIFSVLFVAVSHCDKEIFCLVHWATATNRFFVGCTESLWQTKFVYVPGKNPKRAQNAKFVGTFFICWHFL